MFNRPALQSLKLQSSKKGGGAIVNLIAETKACRSVFYDTYTLEENIRTFNVSSLQSSNKGGGASTPLSRTAISPYKKITRTNRRDSKWN